MRSWQMSSRDPLRNPEVGDEFFFKNAYGTRGDYKVIGVFNDTIEVTEKMTLTNTSKKASVSLTRWFDYCEMWNMKVKHQQLWQKKIIDAF